MSNIRCAITDSKLDKIDAEILLCQVLNKPRSYLYAWPEKTLSSEEKQHYEALVQRRQSGEPIAYITGIKEFWSLPFYVTPAVLIPRPETELLVALVLEGEYPIIADLGTGSGAIACAIAHEKPNWQIIAVDQSKAALEVAQQNAKALKLRNIKFQLGSWCEHLLANSLDAIISNPPYIEACDAHLSQGDVRFEPKSALASGIDGLKDIRLIIEQAKICLKPGGLLALEHGYNQASAVAELLKKAAFNQIQHREDIQGIQRLTIAYQ